MRVGLIVIGVGPMGSNAVRLITKLRDYLRRAHGIDLELLAIADIAESDRDCLTGFRFHFSTSILYQNHVI